MGADVQKGESIVNLTGNLSLIFQVSMALLTIGIALLASVILTNRAPSATPLLGLAIICGYLYQGPPFRCVSTPLLSRPGCLAID